MLNKIFIFIFVLIILLIGSVIAQNENTFVVRKSESTISPTSTNQNSLNKISTLSLNQIKVNFITNPVNSILYIDNIDYGITPRSVNLDPGSHMVEISKSGYFTANFNIFIKSGYEYTYTVKMYPGSGTPIPFFTDLRIANNYPQGLSVLFITDVSGGSGRYSYTWNFGDGSIQTTSINNVQHTFPNSGTFTTTVVVNDLITGHSSTSFRKFTLRNNESNNLNGTLRISSNPPNSTIVINGLNYGKTPKNISLEPGIYRIELSMPGYSNRSYILTIRKSSIYNLKVNLRQSISNSGVDGTIRYGPIRPVCTIGDSCDRAYSGSVIIKDFNQTKTVKSFYTNFKGQFSIKLLPGSYMLIVNRRFIRPCEQKVTVSFDNYAHINMTCDTGIR